MNLRAPARGAKPAKQDPEFSLLRDKLEQFGKKWEIQACAAGSSDPACQHQAAKSLSTMVALLEQHKAVARKAQTRHVAGREVAWAPLLESLLSPRTDPGVRSGLVLPAVASLAGLMPEIISLGCCPSLLAMLDSARQYPSDDGPMGHTGPLIATGAHVVCCLLASLPLWRSAAVAPHWRSTHGSARLHSHLVRCVGAAAAAEVSGGVGGRGTAAMGYLASGLRLVLVLVRTAGYVRREMLEQMCSWLPLLLDAHAAATATAATVTASPAYTTTAATAKTTATATRSGPVMSLHSAAPPTDTESRVVQALVLSLLLQLSDSPRFWAALLRSLPTPALPSPALPPLRAPLQAATTAVAAVVVVGGQKAAGAVEAPVLRAGAGDCFEGRLSLGRSREGGGGRSGDGPLLAARLLGELFVHVDSGEGGGRGGRGGGAWSSGDERVRSEGGVMRLGGTGGLSPLLPAAAALLCHPGLWRGDTLAANGGGVSQDGVGGVQLGGGGAGASCGDGDGGGGGTAAAAVASSRRLVVESTLRVILRTTGAAMRMDEGGAGGAEGVHVLRPPEAVYELLPVLAAAVAPAPAPTPYGSKPPGPPGPKACDSVLWAKALVPVMALAVRKLLTGSGTITAATPHSTAAAGSSPATAPTDTTVALLPEESAATAAAAAVGGGAGPGGCGGGAECTAAEAAAWLLLRVLAPEASAEQMAHAAICAARLAAVTTTPTAVGDNRTAALAAAATEAAARAVIEHFALLGGGGGCGVGSPGLGEFLLSGRRGLPVEATAAGRGAEQAAGGTEDDSGGGGGGLWEASAEGLPVHHQLRRLQVLVAAAAVPSTGVRQPEPLVRHHRCEALTACCNELLKAQQRAPAALVANGTQPSQPSDRTVTGLWGLIATHAALAAALRVVNTAQMSTAGGTAAVRLTLHAPRGLRRRLIAVLTRPDGVVCDNDAGDGASYDGGGEGDGSDDGTTDDGGVNASDRFDPVRNVSAAAAGEAATAPARLCRTIRRLLWCEIRCTAAAFLSACYGQLGGGPTTGLIACQVGGDCYSATAIASAAVVSATATATAATDCSHDVDGDNEFDVDDSFGSGPPAHLRDLLTAYSDARFTLRKPPGGVITPPQHTDSPSQPSQPPQPMETAAVVNAPAALVAAGCPLLATRLREALWAAAHAHALPSPSPSPSAPSRPPRVGQQADSHPSAPAADGDGDGDGRGGGVETAAREHCLRVVGWPRTLQVSLSSKVPRAAFTAVIDYLTTGVAQLPPAAPTASATAAVGTAAVVSALSSRAGGAGNGTVNAAGGGGGHGPRGASREVATLAAALGLTSLRALARATPPYLGNAPPPPMPRLSSLLPRCMLLPVAVAPSGIRTAKGGPAPPGEGPARPQDGWKEKPEVGVEAEVGALTYGSQLLRYAHPGCLHPRLEDQLTAVAAWEQEQDALRHPAAASGGGRIGTPSAGPPHGLPPYALVDLRCLEGDTSESSRSRSSGGSGGRSVAPKALGDPNGPSWPADALIAVPLLRYIRSNATRQCVSQDISRRDVGGDASGVAPAGASHCPPTADESYLASGECGSGDGDGGVPSDGGDGNGDGGVPRPDIPSPLSGRPGADAMSTSDMAPHLADEPDTTRPDADSSAGAHAAMRGGSNTCGSGGGDDGEEAACRTVCRTVLVPAHRIVLAAGCEYFAALCSDRWQTMGASTHDDNDNGNECGSGGVGTDDGDDGRDESATYYLRPSNNKTWGYTSYRRSHCAEARYGQGSCNHRKPSVQSTAPKLPGASAGSTASSAGVGISCLRDHPTCSNPSAVPDASDERLARGDFSSGVDSTQDAVRRDDSELVLKLKVMRAPGCDAEVLTALLYGMHTDTYEGVGGGSSCVTNLSRAACSPVVPPAMRACACEWAPLAPSRDPTAVELRNGSSCFKAAEVSCSWPSQDGGVGPTALGRSSGSREGGGTAGKGQLRQAAEQMSVTGSRGESCSAVGGSGRGDGVCESCRELRLCVRMMLACNALLLPRLEHHATQRALELLRRLHCRRDPPRQSSDIPSEGCTTSGSSTSAASCLLTAVRDGAVAGLPWLATTALEDLTQRFGSSEVRLMAEWQDLPQALQRAALDGWARRARHATVTPTSSPSSPAALASFPAGATGTLESDVGSGAPGSSARAGTLFLGGAGVHGRLAGGAGRLEGSRLATREHSNGLTRAMRLLSESLS